MVGTMASLPRVRVSDLITDDGLPPENYKMAISNLWHSLSRFNATVIQILPSDEALFTYSADSAKLYFQSKTSSTGMPQSADSESTVSEWNRAPGYYPEPLIGRESYEYRPGRAAVPGDDDSVPPSCLPQLYARLGSISRIILEGIARALDLRSYSFMDMLDNVPLKASEQASSVLAAVCHGRKAFTGDSALEAVDVTAPLQEESDSHLEKALLTLVKSSQPGLYVKDNQQHWMLVDHDLQANEVVVLAGLTLYQASGGFVVPSVFKTDVQAAQFAMSSGRDPAAPLPHPGTSLLPHGRVSLVFKLQAKPSAVIHCSAMAAAGHQISTQFQAPVAVSGFMQRSIPVEDVLSARFRSPGMSAEKRKRRSVPSQALVLAGEVHSAPPSSSSSAPSKKLRAEAQRVLKERVQDLAQSKNIKIKFCSIKECEEQHMCVENPPCGTLRAELSWPAQVPFVHPHDMNNRAKQLFLECFEPGWSHKQLRDPAMEDAPKMGSYPGVQQSGEDRFALKAIYDFLRSHSRPVPTGKPQVAGHKVDIPLLCRLAFEAGGGEAFEQGNGFHMFVASTFNLDNAQEREKERAADRLKKLFDLILSDYVNHLLVLALEAAGGHAKEEEEEDQSAVLHLVGSLDADHGAQDKPWDSRDPPGGL